MTNKMRFISTIYVTSLFILCGCDVNTTNSAQSGIHLQPSSYTELISAFDQLNYHWETLEEGVPAFTLDRFPHDMGAIYDVKLKKKLFFLSLLPMVIMQNEAILEQRNHLKNLLNTTRPLTSEQNRWLANLCRRYQCPGDPVKDGAIRQKLLQRVDIVPIALVLAQAANESAYGTSRFAQKANNIFGQWTFTPGTGLVPSDRPAGATYEVRKFNTLADSIRSYMNNLNTHPAYQTLREKRAALRQADAPLEGKKLAEGLLNYSTRRDAYVDEIQSMIRHNRLAKLASVKLRKEIQLAGAPLLPHHQLSSRNASKGVARSSL